MLDLDGYRAEAEEFVSALDREYYLHFSGQRDSYDIEPIYERHAGLFTRWVVEELRREHGALLEFAVHGLVGRATKEEQAELARREAALEVDVDGRRLPFREAAVAQANERDPERRAAIERARLAATEEQLNPLLLDATARSHELARELGWESMRAMCEELSGIDLGALRAQTERFLRETEALYEAIVSPELERQLGIGLRELRRSDLPAFFRAPGLDGEFPADGLVPSLAGTLAGIGIDVARQPGVILDTEHRPKKSPRAFCAAVRVPHEVYLVIARIGGREDYSALFHEAGHTEHYAHVDPELPVEARYFGDNSVTEGFAFLFEHLVEDPAWLRGRLDIAEPERIAGYARAVKLVFVRRYCGKLAYELELHGADGSLYGMADVYARRLSDAVRVEWPSETWLSDVDAFFYAARYLRAWILETHLRKTLRERFGELWFEQEEAGEMLRSLWRRGQGEDARQALAELAGGELDFGVLLEELG